MVALAIRSNLLKPQLFFSSSESVFSRHHLLFGNYVFSVHVQDCSALLAYEQPEKSTVGYLLEDSQRELVADAVNAFVLSLNPSLDDRKSCLQSHLEKLLRQLTACFLERRSLNGDQGEAFHIRRILEASVRRVQLSKIKLLCLDSLHISRWLSARPKVEVYACLSYFKVEVLCIKYVSGFLHCSVLWFFLHVNVCISERYSQTVQLIVNYRFLHIGS